LAPHRRGSVNEETPKKDWGKPKVIKKVDDESQKCLM